MNTGISPGAKWFTLCLPFFQYLFFHCKFTISISVSVCRCKSKVFLWRERKCNQDPNMGHINSKSSHDITPKAIESLLEFLRIGYNGKNRTHVLHQSQ